MCIDRKKVLGEELVFVCVGYWVEYRFWSSLRMNCAFRECLSEALCSASSCLG